MRTQLPSALLATALAYTYFAAPAQAQSPRTFVSAAGNDSNPCTFAAPCRHFQAAVNATSLGGEVDALDPAGYGPFVITQAITIEGQGWSYIAPPANGNGITINAVSGSVAIHGVSLNGAGITGATTGIAFFSGGQLEIIDCVVRNFSSSGIALAPTSSATITVSRTLAAENTGHGIFLQPSGNVRAVFNRVEAYHNGQKGIGIFGNIDAFLLDAVIVDSVAAYNEDGFYALGDGQILGHVNVRVNRSTTYGNGAGSNGAGLRAEGYATMWVSQTDLNESLTPWAEDSNSCILTYGDNNTHNAPPVCSLFPVIQKY